MVKRDITLRLPKKLLVILGILLLLVLLSFLIPSPSLQQELTVSPANYSVSLVSAQQAYDVIIDEGGYSFVEDAVTSVYAYNEQIPGPLLRGMVGETITVQVQNNLDEPTTIHWHGLILDNVQDGVPQVTQDPILPGESFTYEVELRNPGLYWYHSHVEAHKQVESGLYGPLLITEDDEEDSGTILMIDDVLLGDDDEFRSFDLGVMHGRFGNYLLVNGEQHPTIHMESNRLRLVNPANARSFTLSFGVPFTVIGMDIGLSEEYTETLLTIHPGERYDIFLDAEEGDELALQYVTGRGNYPLATLFVGETVARPSHSFALPFSPEELLEKEPDLTADLAGFMGGHRGFTWAINRKYYPETTEIFTVQKGELTKMRITNTQGQPHPMHLHGQRFIVLARNGELAEHFGWKDTVMVGNRETVDIVFIPEEQGDWVFHCHILEHAEAGMLSVVRVE